MNQIFIIIFNIKWHTVPTEKHMPSLQEGNTTLKIDKKIQTNSILTKIVPLLGLLASMMKATIPIPKTLTLFTN